MPEYHQIQTYIDLKSNLSTVKSSCAKFFETLGWLNPMVQQWLDDLLWENSEDGVVYGPTLGPQMRYQQFAIRLTFLGWDPQSVPSLDRNCVELAILFESEQIDDHSRLPQIRYIERAENTVWHIMREAGRHFRDYGVFFTDEWQDGNAWEGLIDNNLDKSWQFELGIVFPQYESTYHPIRSEYFAKVLKEELWLARKLAWDKPPWA